MTRSSQSPPPACQKITASSDQIKAEIKNGPGLGKKDLNIIVSLLTSYRSAIAVYDAYVGRRVDEALAGQTNDKTGYQQLSSAAMRAELFLWVSPVKDCQWMVSVRHTSL
ncbi:hypothetical protein MJ390_06690 [Klebsiella pneumoniae]|nr:hypothetical protein MJ390_06690 [Klebsiella pneumoniae]